MVVIGIDPGYKQSALVTVATGKPKPKILHHEIAENNDILKKISLIASDVEQKYNYLAIEMMSCYGMRVGEEVFETVYWIGRFSQVWLTGVGREPFRPLRRDIKTWLTGSNRSNDADVRERLIRYYGAPGTKDNPGPTFGIVRDQWSALAVATYQLHKLQ